MPTLPGHRFTWPLPERKPGRNYNEGYTWHPPDAVQPAVLSVGRGLFDAQNVRAEWRCQNPNWVIDCPLDPGMHSRVKTTRRPWRPRAVGELYLYPPTVPYWERSTPEQAVHSLFVVFRGGECAALQDLVDTATGYAGFIDPDGVAWRRLEQAVDVGLELGADGFWEAQASLLLLLATLLKAPRVAPGEFRLDQPLESPNPQATFRAAVDSHMRKHLSGGLTLAALADSQHMSVSTFCRRYREVADQPPMARYLSLRLATGKALLMKGEALKAIAHRTGFSDAYHFSRAFKQEFGCSPSTFRRQHGTTP